MRQEEKTHFVLFLLDVSHQQLKSFLKIMTKEQLQTIIEIIYNVVQEVCSISEMDKKVLVKHKTRIRKIVSRSTTRGQRKLLLVKIRKLLPIFFKAYLHYVT